jgi:uncharacterized small protein (DUF1192 family)
MSETKKNVTPPAADVEALQNRIAELEEKNGVLEKTIEELMAANQSTVVEKPTGNTLKHDGVEYKVLTPKFYVKAGDQQMVLVTVTELKKNKALVAAAIEAGNLVPVEGKN